MVNDVLLTPAAYHVLERVPSEWFDEALARKEIASALHVSATSVSSSLAHLIRLRLVERRRRATIAPCDEIRRVGRG